MNVAVLGLGRMGTAMATSLVAAGHQVVTWNRSERSVPGAVAAPTPADAVADAGIAVVMVLDGPAASAVLDGLTGPAPAHGLPGVAASDDLSVVTVAPGRSLLVVQMSTIAPAESAELAERCAEAGLRYLEAPVLGSVPNVRASGLTVLAGGSEEDLAEARPVLDVWSSAGRIVHTGPVGTATGLKLVANLSLGIAAAGLHDCVALGAALGLSREAVLDILELGSLGGLVKRKRDRLDSGDYADADFTVGALSKDLALADAAAGSTLPMLQAAAALASAATVLDPSQDLAVLAAGDQ